MTAGRTATLIACGRNLPDDASMDKPHRRTSQAPSDLAVVAAIGLKGVLEALPGGGVLYDLVMAQRAKVQDAMASEQERRLDTFYAALVRGNASMEEQVARVMLDQADFHALLRACVADIEGEKSRSYAELARAIASSAVEGSQRRHFVLALRDLSFEELSLLRSAHVAKHHPNLMPGIGGGSVEQRTFLDGHSPGSPKAIQVANLAAKGLVHDAKLTELGDAFTLATWRPDDLTPESIGLQSWSGYHVLIIDYEIGDPEMDRIANRLANELRTQRHRSSIAAITREFRQRMFMLSAPQTVGVLLVGQRHDRIAKNAEYLAGLLAKVPTVAVGALCAPSSLPSLPLVGALDVVGIGPESIVQEVCREVSELIRTRRRPAPR